jgi:putative FmdB family regulatory protein
MLYEFQCEKCKKVTEELVKLGTEKIKCPACGAPAFKILSVPNFVVHGFSYKNLYSSTRSSSKTTSKSEN